MGKSSSPAHSAKTVIKKPAALKGVNKVSEGARVGNHQALRHRDIVSCLRMELSDWVQQLEGGGNHEVKLPKTLVCPICGRSSNRRRNMVRHANTHTSGKLAVMVDTLESGGKIQHPVIMEVIRALHDHDSVLGNITGNYAKRAQTLLSDWLRFETSASDTGSLFSRLGPRDKNVALVYTKSGPQFWSLKDSRLEAARKFTRKLFYTQDFANMFMRHAFEAGGIYTRAFRAVRQAWQGLGCEVTHLMTRRSQTMSALACDIMESGPVGDMLAKTALRLGKHNEFRSISVDGTYKIPLKVAGQTPDQKHSFTTVVGLRGSPLGLVEARGESPATVASVVEKVVPAALRDQVGHVALDTCNKRLFDALARVLGGLHAISLDPHHTCFRVDSFSKKRRIRPTLIGLVMRTIMGKFAIPDPGRAREAYFKGDTTPELTAEQLVMVDHIKNGTITKKKAKQILHEMNPNIAISSLLEFQELIAAVVCMYPDNMDTKRDNTTLRRSLVETCTPTRFEWLLNGLRHRARLPASLEGYMAVGTTRNEQIHARLNTHFHTTVCVSKRVLAAEMRVWLCGEIQVFERAMLAKLSRRVSRGDFAAALWSTLTVFTDAGWREYIATAPTMWEGNTLEEKRRRAKRKGPNMEQATLYDSIRAKVVKRRRLSVYNSVVVRG